MFEKIDHWIIDNFFQRIVDWGNKYMDVTKTFFLVASFCLLGAGLMFHTYLILREGGIPIVSFIVCALFVIWGPNLINHIVSRSEREEKGGFAPKSRASEIDRFVRLCYPVFILLETIRIFISSDRSVSDFMDPIGFISVWALYGFLVCRNNPPTFKKKVPSPA
ncbi:MAG: hypothetical protein ACJKSS_02600 [Patescibacteria group bacterium UBA2103]